ncbi:MAG: PAS domain S-box protein [Armatimonadetes bacterium]|nr:PAS domain S-box protein [Armatimonadota bacterium]
MTALRRTIRLHEAFLQKNYRAVDGLFLWLMGLQYVAAVVAALTLTPTTWSGTQRVVHPHVWSALVLGGVITAPAVVMILVRSGSKATQYTIAVCQMLMSSLLVHLSGGRIETHFHIFGSLAFLAFYRDWKILIPATIVTAGDHVLRGLYFPMSVYGVPTDAEFRFLEHTGWVLFEDVFLFLACRTTSAEAWTMAERQAALEETNELVEQAVSRRTEELVETVLGKSAVFESALDGIFVFGPAGQVIEANGAAIGMFGLSEADLDGLTFEQIWAESSLSELEGRAGRTGSLAWASGRHLELVARKSTGDVFPVELAVAKIGGRGEAQYAAVLRDLSERTRLQARVLQATKMESLGQLAVGVAHEINTPNQYIGDNLTYVAESFDRIADYVRICRDLEVVGSEDEFRSVQERIVGAARKGDVSYSLDEIPAALSQAQEGVARVGQIVKAMKEFAHPGTPDLTATDVNKVVQNAIAVTRNEWKYVSQMSDDLQPDVPIVQGHPGELGQAVLNLIVNAAHAIKEKFDGRPDGHITVRTRSDGHAVVIEVADNGTGIPAAVRPKIFDPFSTTKGVGIGTGQGLSVAHSIVVKHGGELSFETEEGAGTCFRVSLPIVRQDKEQAA